MIGTEEFTKQTSVTKQREEWVQMFQEMLQQRKVKNVMVRISSQ